MRKTKQDRFLSNKAPWPTPLALLLALALGACTASPTAPPLRTRAESLAEINSQFDPTDDAFPPVIASGWSEPQPLPGPVNSAGVEDSPFLSPDGDWLFFFFTPDHSAPSGDQIYDGVTGIWVARRDGESWAEPERVALAAPRIFALDGCPTLAGDALYFCSARYENHSEVDLFRADWDTGVVADWENMGETINLDYRVGEMHLSADGQTMIFSSAREGGQGGYDLWSSQWQDGAWGEPVNLGEAINSPADENRPYLSPDGDELWFDVSNREGLLGPAIYRAERQPDGSWSEPVLMVSQLAGEPNLSADGSTLYFAHYYLDPETGEVIEADIYVSQRITPSTDN